MSVSDGAKLIGLLIRGVRLGYRHVQNVRSEDARVQEMLDSIGREIQQVESRCEEVLGSQCFAGTRAPQSVDTVVDEESLPIPEDLQSVASGLVGLVGGDDAQEVFDSSTVAPSTGDDSSLQASQIYNRVVDEIEKKFDKQPHSDKVARRCLVLMGVCQ